MSKPRQHLVFGPQGERVIVTEEEARNWEAKNIERRNAQTTEEEEQEEVCPTCGRPKLPLDEDLLDEEDNER